MRPTRVSASSILTVLVAALVGSLLAISPATAATPAPAPQPAASMFDDVASGAFYADAVAWLADADITTGTGPSTFSPDDSVTRGQMAAFLERYAQIDGDPGEHGFGDVPAGAFYDGSVTFLVENDITTGTSPSTYSPDDVVTRAQMATFLWRFSNEPEVIGATPFTDVPAGTFYSDAVAWLYGADITTGTTPTTYAPNDVVTRGQMATFLWRLAGEPEVGELGLNRYDPDAATIADEDDTEFTTLDADGTSTLEWTGADTDRPEVGQVVAIGITDETPDGFLGKVTSVSGDTVTTEPAALNEAIPEADFDLSVDLDEDDLQQQGFAPASATAASSGLAPAGLFDTAKENATLSCEGSSTVEVAASITVEPSLTLDASWSLLGGAYFRAEAKAEITPSLSARWTGELECEAKTEIAGPDLKPITFTLAGFPVVIQPEITFEPRVYINAAASAEPSISYTETVGVAIVYDDDWSIEYPQGPDDGWDIGTEFSGDASIGFEVLVRLDLRAYDTVGVFLRLGPFLEFGVQYDDPWWNLDVGVRAGAGVTVSLFDLWEAEADFGTIDLWRYTLAEAESTADRPADEDFVDTSNLRTRMVDAGDDHTCAITIDDRVACWGANGRYQHGNGDPVQHNVPVWAAIGNDTPAIDISAGGSHTCAVFADYTAECWGKNDFGQIGHGVLEANTTTPAAVTGLPDIHRIEAGGEHTCALSLDFEVWCWGEGANGATGLGTFDDVRTPQRVEGLGDVVDLAVSGLHTCAVEAIGRLWCWGNNGYDETKPDSGEARFNSPQLVAGVDDAVLVATGFGTTCYVTSADNDGEIWCWGRNNRGQRGNGDNLNSPSSPTRTLTNLPAVQIDSGKDHTCAILHDADDPGAAAPATWCWGYNFHDQNGGDTNATDVVTPLEVVGQDGAEHVTAGDAHTCLQTSTGRTQCWGGDFFGQLGNDETEANRKTPAYVAVPY